MEKVIDNEYVTLMVYPNKGIVHHQVHKFLAAKEFQEFFLKGAEVFEKHRCSKWLSNDSKSAALRPQDLEWAQSVWEPRILKAGWKHWAVILPEKVMGQMNMQRLVERYENLGVTVQTFSDEKDAMNWLESA